MILLKSLWKLLPFVIVFVIYAAYKQPFGQAWAETVPASLPYFLSTLLILVSLIFNRSRLALAAVNACLCYAIIQNGMQKPFAESSTQMLFIGSAFLFSFHLCLVAFFRERGSVSSWGVARLSLIVLSYVILWIGVRDNYLDPLYFSLDPVLSETYFERAWISSALLFVQIASGLTLAIITLIKRTSTEMALLASWLTGNTLFLDFDQFAISTILTSALVLAMFISLVQSAYDLAFVDALTLLPGRRALNEKLGTLNRRYGIAMLDVDHFKKFNDTYGHDVGDQVLKLVASKIRKVGSRGMAYRYGGEEFSILFSNHDINSVKKALDGVRESIENYSMTIRGKTRESSRKKGEKLRGIFNSKPESVSVTISIGFAEYRHGDHSAEEVLKRADDALYTAKKNGRNRVEIAPQIDEDETDKPAKPDKAA